MDKWLFLIIALILIYLFYKAYFYKPSFGENSIVKKSSKYKPNKLLVTAHPDDEILWGYRYLNKDPQNWKVICLTCAIDKTRTNEFEKVMYDLKIENYEIWDHDNSVFATSLDKRCIDKLKSDILKNNYKLILTHNSYGEYGNLQHMSVHRELKKLKQKYGFPIKFFGISNYHSSEDKQNLLKNYNSQKLIISSLSLIHPFY